MIVQALVLAYLYPVFRRGRAAIAEGMRFGILMGIFMGSSAVFAEAGKQEVSSLPTWLVLESTYYIVQFAIVGTIVGLIYGKAAPDGTSEVGHSTTS